MKWRKKNTIIIHLLTGNLAYIHHQGNWCTNMYATVQQQHQQQQQQKSGSNERKKKWAQTEK